MWLRTSIRAALVIIALASLAVTAQAVIKVEYPLGDLVKQSPQVIVARIDRYDADKPGAVLVPEKPLKGEAAWARLPVNLADSGDALKPELLKRLAAELPLVLFVGPENKGVVRILAFTNGTWFEIRGQRDGNDLRWAYTNCEIYLRRTFKGTTAELEQTVANVLAGKAKPPPVDKKEKPGLGPVIAE